MFPKVIFFKFQWLLILILIWDLNFVYLQPQKDFHEYYLAKKKKKTASLIFEGDWEESILTIKNQSFHHPFVGYLIKEIMSSINSLQFFSFSHTRQQGNSLAHALAKRARSSFPVLVWRKSIPSDIYKFYVSDVVEKK